MTTARIDTTPDGPLLLVGDVPIRTADYVFSEQGEPMTWSYGAPMDTDAASDDGVIALCRCGHSGNKPYCDGSHVDAEWDPDVAEQPRAPYAERARRKDGTDYTLLDDTPLCMHAGLCGTARTTVWKMVRDTDDSGVRGEVIRMVEKCPSGRLTNVIGGEIVEQSLPVEVGVVPGGPLWVTGGIEVRLPDGESTETRNRVTLCRCGASDNKPLCDGSHRDIDFDG